MLTTERIQAKGGEAHQELLHNQSPVSGFYSFSYLYYLLYQASVGREREVQFYIVKTVLQLVSCHLKV